MAAAAQAARAATSLDAGEAARRIAAGRLLLVDLRGDAAWRAGHVPGALHLPLAALPSRLADLADDGRPLGFVCASGYRSAAACAIARRHGVPALNVHGGMAAWRRAGLRVEGSGRERDA